MEALTSRKSPRPTRATQGLFSPSFLLNQITQRQNCLGRRGYFFTLDGLFAAVVLLGALLLFTSYGEIQPPVIQLNFAASDVLSALDDVHFLDLNSTGRATIGNSTVEQNQSVLGVIGDLWSRSELGYATNLTQFMLEGKVPDSYGIGLWMDNDQIYARTSPAPNTRASARTIISGLTKTQPSKGFISRANAESVTTRKTKIYSFSAQGAGWDGSTANPSRAYVTKWVNISGSVDNATLAISLHLNPSDTNWNVITINNGTTAACNFTRSEISNSGEGYYDIEDVKACLHQGINKFRLDLRNSVYNAHIHPGMLLRVDYSETTSVPTYNTNVRERIYFDNLTSVAGASASTGTWQLVPFHIPPEAQNVSVYMQIAARGITNYGGSNWFYSWDGWRRQRDNDYILFFNDDDPLATSSAPPTNPQYNYSPSTLAPHIVNGTNVVTVYFNNYEDYVWGSSTQTIYSEPYADPNQSSFIEVNYTIPAASLPYGQIELTGIEQSTGAEYYRKTVNFTFPSGATMSSVYGHIAQRFSYLVTVEADDYSPPTTDVFESPSSRGVPTDIYISTATLSENPAINFVEFTDSNNNEIIPNTSVEYKFFLPSFVGFGEIFNSTEEATADAQARLTALLGGYVDLNSINFETNNITDVPTLWGPAIVEVRVWR